MLEVLNTNAASASAVPYRKQLPVWIDAAVRDCGQKPRTARSRDILQNCFLRVDKEILAGKIRKNVQVLHVSVQHGQDVWDRKEIGGPNLLSSNKLELTFPQHPEIVIRRGTDRSAASGRHAKHACRRAVPQQRSYWVPGRLPTQGVIRGGQVGSTDRHTSFGILGGIQIESGDQAIDEGPRFDKARSGTPGRDLCDENRILVTHALSASRHSEERLMRESLLQTLDEPVDRLRLITRGGKIRLELEGPMLRLLHEPVLCCLADVRDRARRASARMAGAGAIS
jgi:hypothetical protein